MLRKTLWASVVLLLLLLAVTTEAFDPLRHSGPASPYFDAPSQAGIPPTTPENCKVDQAAYILRHGSRYPEPGSFQGWQNLFAKFQNVSAVRGGPLSFIPSWVPPVDDLPHEPLFLSSTGAGEAFGLGVELRKRYGFTKGGENFTVWSASQQRCVDTASYFLRGYLSQGNYLTSPELNRGHIITLPDSVNFTFADSLTPSAACPTYNAGNTGSAKSSAFRMTYQGNIAKRLNRFLDGKKLELDAVDVAVMQDLCGFQAEIDGDTRFCDVFEESEWLDYEYAHDLNYYYGSGPGNPIAAATGLPWVQAITKLFVAGPGQSSSTGFRPPSLIMGFTHDNNLPPVVAALGLWNTSTTRGVYPLSLTRPNPARQFRSSYLVAFRGYVALERLSCTRPPNDRDAKLIENQLPQNSAEGIFVRVRINRAVVPIPGCSSGPGESCPLQSFEKYVKLRGSLSGDFVDRCGLEGVANATSMVSFLTTVPDPKNVQIISL